MSGADVQTTGEGMPLGPVVVWGSASAEEIAAVVAVLTALGGGEGATAPASTPGWADHARSVRSGLPHGRGAWRASGLPH